VVFLARLRRSATRPRRDAAAFHQDALGLLDNDAAPERAVDATELGVAAQDDVQRMGQLGAAAVLDVGEDAAFGGVVDELVIFGRDVGRSRGTRLS